MEDRPNGFESKSQLIGIIILLTWVTGSLDVISYIQLQHVFTANMTGNTALLGLAIGRGEFSAAGRSAFALLGYVCGVAAGVAMGEYRNPSAASKRPAIRPLIAEGGVLGLFVITGHFVFPAPSPVAVHIMIVISGVVMGIQSAAVRRLNLPGVVTTYITGTITILTSGLVLWLRASHEPTAPPSAGRTIDWESRLELQAAVFGAYGIAALVTAVVQRRWPIAALCLPLLAIAIVLAGTLRAWIAPGKTNGATEA